MRGKMGICVFHVVTASENECLPNGADVWLQDPNIFNIAVEGVFDDCQDMVRQYQRFGI